MDIFVAAIEQALGANRVKTQEMLAQYTTFRCGGPGDYFTSVSTIDELLTVVRTARAQGLPVFVFGGGTNMIVSEKGIRGVVIKNNCRNFSFAPADSFVELTVEAGAIMNIVVRAAIAESLSGIEYQLGLPGTVGGALVVNAQYPKRALHASESLLKATILTPEGEVKEVDKSYFAYSFASSRIIESGDILLSATFRLITGDHTEIEKRAEEANTYRHSTQPIGQAPAMTFRNMEFQNEKGLPVEMLFKNANLLGKHVGDVTSAEINPRYFLNTGSAKPQDVILLGEQIRKEFAKVYGKELIFEVKITGESA